MGRATDLSFIHGPLSTSSSDSCAAEPGVTRVSPGVVPKQAIGPESSKGLVHALHVGDPGTTRSPQALAGGMIPGHST